MNRIVWIDLLRGICMMLIIWFHTEMYYAGTDITPYNAYVANALTTFFFISGYLFHNLKPFSLKHKLKSIVRGIVIPYFFFTLLLAIPKAVVNDISINEVITKILLGNGSWFVTSLIMAEIIFSFILYAYKRWLLHLLPVICLISAWLLTGTQLSNHYNYWNIHNALIAVSFLYVGYQYHCNEQVLNSIFSKVPYFILLALFFIAIKIYVLNTNTSLLLEPVLINNYPVFLLDCISCIFLLTTISKYLPSVKFIEWIGKHTLVYYFFCGAVPMTVAKILEYTGLSYQNAFMLIPTFIIITIVSTIITFLCYRFLPILKSNV